MIIQVFRQDVLVGRFRQFSVHVGLWVYFGLSIIPFIVGHISVFLLTHLLLLSFQAAYDKILKARKAAEIRHRQYDAKRKKFKDGKEF